MKNKAFGFIETKGLVGAVEALDACLKTADVRLVSKEKSTGGLITIVVTGDVGAVKEAIKAGTYASKRFGAMISAHVIPRISDEVVDTFYHGKSEKKKESEVAELTQPMISDELGDVEGYDLNDISIYKVVELRQIARTLKIATIDRNKIKFANKAQLTEAIEKHLKGGI